MSIGWLKLYRKSIRSRAFANDGLWKVWTWCLMRANYEKSWATVDIGGGTTEVELKPGQFIFGRHKAASELRMKPSTTWKRMLKLKNMQNLTIESNSHYSIVSIMNWEDYQSDDENCNSNSNKEGTAREQPGNSQGTQYKKDKKPKKSKNKEKPIGVPAPKNGSPLATYPYPDWLNKSLWADFHRMRSRINKPITTKRTITGLLKKLNTLISNGYLQDDIIQTAIDNCWRSFFPPKSQGRQLIPTTVSQAKTLDMHEQIDTLEALRNARKAGDQSGKGKAAGNQPTIGTTKDR